MNRRLQVFACLLLVTWIPVGASNAQPAKPDDARAGRLLYMEHCASCHGPGGKGDGPAARTLRTPLPDLTTLAERSGGVFPAEQVLRVIDGRTPVTDHRPDAMPAWGEILKRLEAGNDKSVRALIDTLVAYIKSLQRTPFD